MAKFNRSKESKIRGSLHNILKSHAAGIYSTEEAIEEIIRLIFNIVKSGNSLIRMVRNLVDLLKSLFNK